MACLLCLGPSGALLVHLRAQCRRLPSLWIPPSVLLAALLQGCSLLSRFLLSRRRRRLQVRYLGQSRHQLRPHRDGRRHREELGCLRHQCCQQNSVNIQADAPSQTSLLQLQPPHHQSHPLCRLLRCQKCQGRRPGKTLGVIMMANLN